MQYSTPYIHPYRQPVTTSSHQPSVISHQSSVTTTHHSPLTSTVQYSTSNSPPVRDQHQIRQVTCSYSITYTTTPPPTITTPSPPYNTHRTPPQPASTRRLNPHPELCTYKKPHHPPLHPLASFSTPPLPPAHTAYCTPPTAHHRPQLHTYCTVHSTVLKNPPPTNPPPRKNTLPSPSIGPLPLLPSTHPPGPHSQCPVSVSYLHLPPRLRVDPPRSMNTGISIQSAVPHSPPNHHHHHHTPPLLHSPQSIHPPGPLNPKPHTHKPPRLPPTTYHTQIASLPKTLLCTVKRSTPPVIPNRDIPAAHTHTYTPTHTHRTYTGSRLTCCAVCM